MLDSILVLNPCSLAILRAKEATKSTGSLWTWADQCDSAVSEFGIGEDIGDDIPGEEMTAGADQDDFLPYFYS